MSRTLFSLVSILLLSLASTSYGLVIGDFEGGLDGWGETPETKPHSPEHCGSRQRQPQPGGEAYRGRPERSGQKADRARVGVRH